MKINYWIPLFILSAFFTACDNRPFHVLSDKKMEAVLFDVYIAQAEMNNNREVFSDSARKHDLLNAVFRKHKITRADFDSSLVWYSDNLERYVKVNEKIIQRYAQMTEDLKNRQLENPEMLIAKRAADFPRNGYVFRADTVLREYNGGYDLWFCAWCEDTLSQSIVR
ncbi:MAG: DUF4296 domain-containing protein [Dysgonamonadaceae bacterium]|nr:DUF4296 domain-containing protein [Dysgonamonadaceae bacterium]